MFFSFHHFHITHNSKILHACKLVLSFSWGDCNIEEKLETLVMQNVFEGRGVSKVYYGQCENGELSRVYRGKKGENCSP